MKNVPLSDKIQVTGVEAPGYNGQGAGIGDSGSADSGVGAPGYNGPAAGIDQGVMVFEMEGLERKEGLRKVKAAIARLRLMRRRSRKADSGVEAPGYVCEPAAAAGQFADGVEQRADAVSQWADAADQMANPICETADVANQFADAVGHFADAACEPADAAGELADAAGQLVNRTGEPADAAEQCADGAGERGNPICEGADGAGEGSLERSPLPVSRSPRLPGFASSRRQVSHSPRLLGSTPSSAEPFHRRAG